MDLSGKEILGISRVIYERFRGNYTTITGLLQEKKQTSVFNKTGKIMFCIGKNKKGNHKKRSE